MDEKELSELIEQRIIDKYKKKLLGAFFGITVGLSVIGFFGYDIIVRSLEDKIINKLTTGDFKDNVAKQVSETINKNSVHIYDEILLYNKKSKVIVKDMEKDHEDLVNVATSEFKRTIEVLNKVREKYDK